MNEHDVIDVLTLIAAYDQRTVGEDDVKAWTQTAHIGKWRTAHAARVVVEHYADQTDRIMPAHITRRLRELRAHFATTYKHQPIPPQVRGVDAEVEWERRQVSEHIDRCMDAWANDTEAAA